MKTIIGGLILILVLRAHATTIQVELGPPAFYPTNAEVRIPFNPGITTFSGQHLDINLTFAGDEFVRLFDSYRHRFSSFEIAPVLVVSGIGTLKDAVGTAYTFDQNGQRNSPIDTSGGGSVLSNDTTQFNFGLTYCFPLFADSSGTLRTDLSFPFNIYGLHIDLTLPTSQDFTINGANLFLGGGGSPSFEIGPHVPDQSNSFLLFGLSLVPLVLLMKKHCP